MSVLDLIKTRRSVRKYRPDPIPPHIMERLIESMRLAPSACNYQPWRFILVLSADQRKQVAAASQRQMWMAGAPLIILACGIPGEAYKFMGGYGNSVEIDVTIALDHLTLAAAEEGMGTCWIGAFDEAELKKILNIPGHVKIVALTPVGYPSDPRALKEPARKRRKEYSEIFAEEKWVW
jgi:nitroreductase